LRPRWLSSRCHSRPRRRKRHCRPTDANGYVDVQALTCAQLAGTYQEDADMLAGWYNGWYNGLAKKHFAHITRAKSGEHQLIVYCKAHPELKIIQAIDVLLKNGK
jgi:hypothetical protein